MTASCWQYSARHKRQGFPAYDSVGCQAGKPFFMSMSRYCARLAPCSCSRARRCQRLSSRHSARRWVSAWHSLSVWPGAAACCPLMSRCIWLPLWDVPSTSRFLVYADERYRFWWYYSDAFPTESLPFLLLMSYFCAFYMNSTGGV